MSSRSSGALEFFPSLSKKNVGNFKLFYKYVKFECNSIFLNRILMQFICEVSHDEVANTQKNNLERVLRTPPFIADDIRVDKF